MSINYIIAEIYIYIYCVCGLLKYIYIVCVCECVRERGYQIKYLITGSFGQGNMYIGSDYGFPIFVGSSSL